MTKIEEDIQFLTKAFGEIDRINPEGDIYKKLCALLDQSDDNTLKILSEAKIKFVSMLASGRMIRRKRDEKNSRYGRG